MLVAISYDLIVETSSIIKIEPLPPEKAGGRGRVRVDFVDGSYEVVRKPLDELERLTGTIIPAPPGYQVVQAYEPEEPGKDWTFQFYPVLAFRLGGEDPMPVGLWGPYSDNWALQWPDGRIEEIGSQLFGSLEEYKAAFREAQK